MKILSMKATFGTLDGDTLVFQPGLNVVSAPNEWGKSTWCAFLTAMLYGVETRERTTKGQIADKEKYQSWSGRPMEGLLRLEHEGRDITIQRRTKGRIPLGEFQAYETRTGLAVPELTGENCGMKLLGVDRSLFERTGFIRFSQMAVVPDEALWQRLQSLAATGDEGAGAAVLGKKLRELKNKCRSSRGGLIPDAKGQIELLQDQLSQREHLEAQCRRLESRGEGARRELQELERHARVCAFREARASREQTEQVAQAAKDANNALESLTERCRGIPPREDLYEKLDEAQLLVEQLRCVAEERTISASVPVVFWILGALALAGSVFCLFRQRFQVALAGALGAVILGLCGGKAADLRRKQALEQRLEQTDREKQVAELMRTIRHLQNQISLLDEQERARRTAEQTRLRLQSIISMAQRSSEDELMDELELSPEETNARIGQLTEQLRQIQLRLGQCQGRMEALPEEETILRRLQAERIRLKELELWEQALEEGLRALEEASAELRRRFAPRLTALAQDYLHRLTGGRYNRLLIGPDLSVQAAKASETTLRSVPWRSDGSADLIYLALRLAVWVTLNPAGPLVLDDALVRLDDERLALTMELLKDLSENRQILLFSCQGREKQLLSQMQS